MQHNIGRNRCVSVARGVAILLMVMAHASFISGYVYSCVYLFHMPLFFIMSGLCYKEKYLEDPVGYAKRKIQGIYLPMVGFGMLFLCFHNIFYRLNIYNEFYGYAGFGTNFYHLGDYIKRLILLFFRLDSAEDMLSGYWFLHSLFYAVFFHYIAARLIRNRFVIVLVFLTAAFLLKFFHWQIPLFVIGSRELLAATFISIGSVLKPYMEKVYYIDLFALVGVLLTLVGAKLWASDMNFHTAHTIIQLTITASFATCSIYRLASLLSDIKKKSVQCVVRFLAFAGDHSLSILTWHLLCFKIISLIFINTHGLSIEHLAEFPTINGTGQIWNLMYFVTGAGIPMIATYICTTIKKRIYENNPDTLYIRR